MTAFRATFADMKLVKTRQVAQLIFEIPIEDFDAAYEVLGGMPVPAKERWFGIAAIKSPEEKEAPAKPRQSNPPSPHPDGAKRDWRNVPYSQQAGIRINEPTFAAYLREEHPDEWHETGEADACLKFICGVNSKTELVSNGKARTLWFQIDTAYQAWLAKERVGA